MVGVCQQESTDCFSLGSFNLWIFGFCTSMYFNHIISLNYRKNHDNLEWINFKGHWKRYDAVSASVII